MVIASIAGLVVSLIVFFKGVDAENASFIWGIVILALTVEFVGSYIFSKKKNVPYTEAMLKMAKWVFLGVIALIGLIIVKIFLDEAKDKENEENMRNAMFQKGVWECSYCHYRFEGETMYALPTNHFSSTCPSPSSPTGKHNIRKIG